MTPNDQDPKAQSARTAARLALLATQPRAAPPGPAPSDDDLAALLDGRLPPADRERVLAQLLADADAYRTWLAAAAGLRTDPAQRARPPAPHPWTRPKRWAVILGAAAVALLTLTVALYRPPPTTLDARIDAGLAALAGSALPSPEALGPRLTSRGATDTDGGDTMGAAAQAGYATARATLGPRSAARTPAPLGPDATAYRVGRWVALLEAAAAADPPPPPAFWPEQAAVGQGLEADLAALGPDPSAHRLAQALWALDDRLAQPPADAGAAWRQSLARQVRYARLHLGLDASPGPTAPLPQQQAPNP